MSAGYCYRWLDCKDSGEPPIRRRDFNFRDVLHECGIPSSKETNWAIGKMLRSIAAAHGVEPARTLTGKTDPNPRVDAPHCIAHYPPTMFQYACDVVRKWWGDRSRQLKLPIGDLDAQQESRT